MPPSRSSDRLHEMQEVSSVSKAVENSNLPAARGVPYANRFSVRGARDQAAIGAEADESHRGLMSGEGGQAFFRRQIPDLHRPVTARAGQPLAIRTECDGVDSLRMTFEVKSPMGLQVPDLQARFCSERQPPIIFRFYAATACEPLAVGAKRYAIRRAEWSPRSNSFLPVAAAPTPTTLV